MGNRSSSVAASVLILAGSLLLAACTPQFTSDPAREAMTINRADAGDSTPAAVATATPAAPAGQAEMVPHTLIASLKDGVKLSAVAARHAFILGGQDVSGGRVLVFIDPVVSDATALAGLRSDAGVVSADYNREFQPATGQAGGVAGSKTGKSGSKSGWYAAPVPSGVVGDSGSGGDSTVLK